MTLSVRTVRGPLVIAAVVVLVDQLTKHWALSALGDGHVVHVVGSLQLNLAFNSGMAFSRGDGLGPFVPVLAVGVIAALLIALGRSDSPWFAVGVGLVIGGSIGNVLDRLFRGEDLPHVVHLLPRRDLHVHDRFDVLGPGRTDKTLCRHGRAPHSFTGSRYRAHRPRNTRAPGNRGGALAGSGC